jgi:hypothetical protein
MNTHRRHDLSDQTWALLEPHLPGRAGQALGVARRETIASLSTTFCGFCARARLGEICHQTMAAEATRTVVLSVGETKVFGEICSQKNARH